MKEIEVEGFITGDGECWCLDVSEEQYIAICGQEDYELEMSVREGEPGERWLLYPGQIFAKAMGRWPDKGLVRFRLEILED
jgi:hypothetical protein